MTPTDGLPPSQRRWVMLCILLGTVLSSLDSAIANIALPVIAHSLGTSDASVIWMVNSYQLASTVCLLPIASLGESLSFKRVYAAGLAVFTLASLGCALSPTLAVLVASRVAQGAGGAAMSVAGMALVRSIYPRSLVTRGFAFIALSVALAGALGPTVAALILAVASWHWLFLVNVPLGLVAVPVFIALAPAGARQPRPFDPVGTLLNALAFGLVVVGVGSLGTGSTRVAAAEIAAGLVGFGLFIRQQARRTSPLLPLDLLRIPVFALSAGTSVCAYAAQILSYVSLPFFFESGLHLSPVQTGLLLTPWPLLVAFAAPIAARLANRYPMTIVSSVGMALLAAGMLLLAMMPAEPAHLDIAWRMALCGIGFGLFQTPNNAAMMTSGPVERSGAASGMTSVSRYVGWSLGSALAALIFGWSGSKATATCLGAGTVIALIGAGLSSARWLKRSPPNR